MSVFDRVTINASKAPQLLAAYSHAVRAGGMLYVSGCLGLDPTTKALVEGGTGPQTRQALTNLQYIVEAGGSSMSKVVKCTVLLTSMTLFAEFNAIYAEFFPEGPPARTTFAVVGLPLGGLVEIDCIAALE